MKLNFHKPSFGKGPIKATIHQSGKLGFSSEAEKAMELGSGKSLRIATNADNISDKNLYVLVVQGRPYDAFPILKAGKYYYLNTKQLFRELELNYTKEKVIFDIEEIEIENTKMFKFVMRILKKKNDMPSEE